MKIKNIIIPILLAMLLSCQNQPKQTVQIAGALRNIIINGDIGAKIDLRDLQNQRHLYALGALENLSGEILIFDGNPYVTSVKDNVVSMDQTFNHFATLLVYTRQQYWQEIEVADGFETLEALESFIAQLAIEQSLSQNQPFPFLIRGKVKSAQWHIIDWPEGDLVHTHEKHKASGLRGTMEYETVEILGFYSDQHHGIISHHTTNMHLHIKNQTGEIAGHLDELSLDKGGILFIPGQRK